MVPLSIALPAVGGRTGRTARPVARPAFGPAASPKARSGTRPRPGVRPQPHSRLLLGLGLALLPWMVVLATSLPTSATASHWSLAWVGLDALEAAGLISTGILLHRDDPRHSLTAVATAALLLTDAWFDITTAAPGGDLTTAVATALIVELPVAFVCARLALRGVTTRG
ncbi:hypothetical protein ABIA33_003332 [Streptacidiphilus sp. MAP12-16]